MGSLRYLPIICLLTLFNCNDQSKNVDSDNLEHAIDSTYLATKVDSSLVGTWELTSYFNYEDNVIADTFGLRDGFRQIKMYSPTKIMWSRQVPKDSLQWFGYGRYKIENGQLVEHLEFGSEMMSEMIKENAEFRFELLMDENNFSQIQLDDEGNRLYSENYKRIE